TTSAGAKGSYVSLIEASPSTTSTDGKPAAEAVARATRALWESSSTSVTLTSARRGCSGNTVRTSPPWPAHMLIKRGGTGGDPAGHRRAVQPTGPEQSAIARPERCRDCRTGRARHGSPGASCPASLAVHLLTTLAPLLRGGGR